MAGNRDHVWVREAPSTVDAEYVQESATVPLRPGQKIAHLFNLNESQEYVLQRVTERTYWFQRDHYACTFYVGEDGVLLFDPLHERGQYVLEAIKRVTDRPVTAIVLSHDHYDHIGDADVVLRAMGEIGVHPRVIASEATAQKQLFRGSSQSRATEVVSWPHSRFQFEDLHVEFHGFARAAHTDDHSAQLLVEEKVLHAADHTNPDEPPFWKFSANENFLYFEPNLRETEELDWVYENGGHGNVGSHADRDFYHQYIADMVEAVRRAMDHIGFRDGVKGVEGINSHTAYHTTWTDLVARTAVDALRPKYGKYYGFEYGTWSNAEQVVWARFAYPR
ncbi:MBL fold metallo-hydrolase [Streptomyces sp. PTD5-9]|uniref:MBL fold metallo-hydrolase n=1 Tax=Streptomyces sp. PTD5-9 TaxID=3120150 RepID=UPI00300BA37B